jgi:hypothetical protein
MVQAYHAVPVSVEYEDVDGDNGRPAENEGSALLGSGASSVGLAKSETQKEGHATLSSSIVNLSNTIIGSGACPFPPIPPSYPSTHDLLSRSLGMLTFPRVRSSRLSQYIVLEADPVFVIILGPRVCRRHPWHVDLRLFWYSCGIWSVSPFCLCATYTPPPLVLLRCRKPHIPSCGRVLRRGYCYQMLWGIYQVRLYCFAYDELRWLME